MLSKVTWISLNKANSEPLDCIWEIWKMNKRSPMHSHSDPRRRWCSKPHQTPKPALWEVSNYLPSGHQGPIMELKIRGERKWNEPELFYRIQDKQSSAGLGLKLGTCPCLLLTFTLNGFRFFFFNSCWDGNVKLTITNSIHKYFIAQHQHKLGLLSPPAPCCSHIFTIL